jgi:hypothetical protein
MRFSLVWEVGWCDVKGKLECLEVLTVIQENELHIQYQYKTR